MCRVEVENWPSSVMKKIDYNHSILREERLEEELAELQRSDAMMGGMVIPTRDGIVVMVPIDIPQGIVHNNQELLEFLRSIGREL